MAKKKKKIQESTIENYYDLKVDKVDELVAALKGEDDFEGEVNYEMNANMGVNDPNNVTKSGKQKKFDPYKIDKFSRIPCWIKAIFIKFWFAGAVCYFIIMGLGNYILGVGGDVGNGIKIGGELDLLVITGMAMGIIVDVFVNSVFRYMETDKKEYNDFMMFPFPFKRFWTFFANMIYYVIVMIGVDLLYFFFNEIVFHNNVNLGIEPLLFGVFSVIVDMIFIGIKDGFVHLARHMRNKKKESVANA